ncbi:MAG: DUF899 domain-containing protein [Pseudomonadales bacterium]
MHEVVDRAGWLEARRALLAKEKALTRLRDEVASARRELPWERVELDYQFEGPDGSETLGDLFAGKHQLIVYHFMYGPDWEEGCKSCSFWADQYDAVNLHIGARDVALAVVSRAPWQTFQPFKARMGWRFKWVSSAGSSFNEDYGVSFPGRERGIYNYRETDVMEELPGLSVFYRDDDGALYHTYSAYSRGLDALNAVYQMLDLVPKGRDEAALDYPMAWVRHHDRY